MVNPHLSTLSALTVLTIHHVPSSITHGTPGGRVQVNFLGVLMWAHAIAVTCLHSRATVFSARAMSQALRDVGAELVRAGLIHSASLQVYDYFCTLDREVELIWSNPSTLASWMFFLNRYLPFFDTFLNIVVNFSTSLSAEQCLIQTKIVIWFMFVGMVISEVILMLRTYAVWERRKSILLFFAILTLTIMVPSIVFTWKEADSLRFVSINGCHATEASNIIFLAYCLLAGYETILAVFIVIKAFQHLRQTRDPWVAKLYKDGILFYFFLLALSCGNILSSVVAPILGPWLETPQRVVHSLLCNRVLFFILQGSASRRRAVAPVTTAVELDIISDDSELPVFALSRFSETSSTAYCHHN
ncbi:hypothetical protein GYMLUDRAFT_264583 [Collybiopsis luxurians FD-317 M1]|uniref:DUF6533 domain-containing protein n=1 Tax=Collybiopsis luxurians FD-317 M1 TaxID=944289 RepID=A0A0D0CHV9_9AGAR|nr:hypothetical protein GYMLUDRAFT_264583 [Collybiopsis luxurians FD-317 M1]